MAGEGKITEITQRKEAEEGRRRNESDFEIEVGEAEQLSKEAVATSPNPRRRRGRVGEASERWIGREAVRQRLRLRVAIEEV